MARVRKIKRTPADVVAYIVDANFLVNKFIPAKVVKDQTERAAVERSMEWWHEIDKQLNVSKAIVYVPDVCIAEAFKVLAKKGTTSTNTSNTQSNTSERATRSAGSYRHPSRHCGQPSERSPSTISRPREI